MKKQVAIVSKKMITGGVERALIAMLKHIDYSQMSVDLYLEQLGGELFDELPSHVNVYQIPRVETVRDILLHPVHTLKKILNRQKLRDSSLPYINQCHLSSSLLLPIKKKYDVAISYHAPNTIPVFYVIDSIQAKKKILWLHGDLYTNAGETAIARQYHARYDQIIAVSKETEKSFQYFHPEYQGSLSTVYNFIDVESIKKLSYQGDGYNDDFNGIRLITVARLAEQKGIDIAIHACNKLKNMGCRIRWYVCGDGQERIQLERLIKEHNLEDSFILLGNCHNPYPYIRQADLYIQTSRYEGYGLSINEAKILGTPVVSTDVTGVREQFEENVTAWIVPINAAEVAKQIKWCIDHPNKVQEARHKLNTYFEDAATSCFDITSYILINL